MKRKLYEFKPTRGWNDQLYSPTLTKDLKKIISNTGKSPANYQSTGNGKRAVTKSALFTGADSNGKGLAAGIIAGRLMKDLYRIDLNQIASKYIGETEKNLAKVFSKAEDKEWILFFDEADALFGKRTGVKDSHDRYANIEINYLLEMIERYPGLVILAANRKENLDNAFLRRLRYIIDFPSGAKKKRR